MLLQQLSTHQFPFSFLSGKNIDHYIRIPFQNVPSDHLRIMSWIHSQTAKLHKKCVLLQKCSKGTQKYVTISPTLTKIESKSLEHSVDNIIVRNNSTCCKIDLIKCWLNLRPDGFSVRNQGRTVPCWLPPRAPRCPPSWPWSSCRSSRFAMIPLWQSDLSTSSWLRPWRTLSRSVWR